MSPPSEKQDVSQLNASFSSGGQDHTAHLYNSAYDGSSNMIYIRPKGGDPLKGFPTIDPDDPSEGWKKFPGPISGPISYPFEPILPIGKDPDTTKPTDAQETDAEKKLDKQIGGLIPDCDRQNLKDADHAILTGDQKALATVLAKYKDDPEKLKAFTDEMNRELKDSGAGVGIHTTSEGKVEVYRDNGHKSVEIDPQTGETTVRNIMVGPDGQVFVGDKDPNTCPDKVMEHIADRAVNNIEDPFRGILSRDPIWENDPIWKHITDPYRHVWEDQPKFDPKLLLM